jgi:hypothetical protein
MYHAWGHEKCTQNFGNIGIDSTVPLILKCILKKLWDMDWIHLALDGDQCGAPVNTPMNL